MRAATRSGLLALTVGILLGSTLTQPAHATLHQGTLREGQSLTYSSSVVRSQDTLRSSTGHSLGFRWTGPKQLSLAVASPGCDLLEFASLPREAAPTARLTMQRDGNLVLYSDGRPIWQTGTYGNRGAYAALLDDRNLVVFDRSGKPLWASQSTCPFATNVSYYDGSPSGQVIRAGQYMQSPSREYRLTMQPDGNFVLYRDDRPAWSSRTAGNPGAYAYLNSSGNLSIIGSKGTIWQTRTGRATSTTTSLAVQNDGNVVLYQRNGTGSATRAVWAAFHLDRQA